MPFIPIAIVVGTWCASRFLVNRKICDALSGAADELEAQLRRYTLNLLLNVISNTAILSIAIFVLPMYFHRETTVSLVCTTYMLSILHGIYSTLLIVPDIWNWTKRFVRHRCNLLEAIEEEIRHQVREEFQSKGLLSRAFISLFGSSQEDVAERARQLVLGIVVRGLSAIAIILVYIAIFRLIVAPTFVDDVTEMGPVISAIYPLLMSVDYFFPTNLLSLI